MKILIIPLLSFIALPTAIEANIDPKVDDICMKAADFKGCLESMTGKNENKLTTNSDYDNALTFYKEGDFLKATKAVKSYLRMNPDSKEGLILSALINAYGWQKFDEAIEDVDYALEVDNNYAYAHALKAAIFYWDLDGSLSKTLEYLEKAINLSPEDPQINFIAGEIQFDNGFVVLGGNTNDLNKKPKDKKALSLESFENAKKSFKKTLENIYLDTYKNPLAESFYDLDVAYMSNGYLGDTKFQLYFLYKDKREGSKAKKYLEEVVVHYTDAISMAPSQKEVIKIELDKDINLYTPAELYLYRGNAYSWMNNKWKKACDDWKVAKKLGDEGARDNFRNFKC